MKEEKTCKSIVEKHVEKLRGFLENTEDAATKQKIQVRIDYFTSLAEKERANATSKKRR